MRPPGEATWLLKPKDALVRLVVAHVDSGIPAQALALAHEGDSLGRSSLRRRAFAWARPVTAMKGGRGVTLPRRPLVLARMRALSGSWTIGAKLPSESNASTFDQVSILLNVRHQRRRDGR